jgi:hypothetical protein
LIEIRDGEKVEDKEAVSEIIRRLHTEGYDTAEKVADMSNAYMRANKDSKTLHIL